MTHTVCVRLKEKDSRHTKDAIAKPTVTTDISQVSWKGSVNSFDIFGHVSNHTIKWVVPLLGRLLKPLR